MKCPNCGTQVGDQALFCFRCGATLENPALVEGGGGALEGATLVMGGGPEAESPTLVGVAGVEPARFCAQCGSQIQGWDLACR